MFRFFAVLAVASSDSILDNAIAWIKDHGTAVLDTTQHCIAAAKIASGLQSKCGQVFNPEGDMGQTVEKKRSEITDHFPSVCWTMAMLKWIVLFKKEVFELSRTNMLQKPDTKLNSCCTSTGGWAAFAAWGLLESVEYIDTPLASELKNSSWIQSAKEQTIKARPAGPPIHAETPVVGPPTSTGLILVYPHDLCIQQVQLDRKTPSQFAKRPGLSGEESWQLATVLRPIGLRERCGILGERVWHLLRWHPVPYPNRGASEITATSWSGAK